MEKQSGDWIELISRETARMSWPARMVGGSQPLLVNINGEVKTKKLLEEFFVKNFGLKRLRERPIKDENFDDWHWQRVECLADELDKKKRRGNPKNRLTAISAKLVNTFLHQLMKYEDFRYLWRSLHLPLDRRVFRKLSQKKCYLDNKASLSQIISNSPYEIDKDEYHDVQESLWCLVERINQQDVWGRTLTSRIELNILWI